MRRRHVQEAIVICTSDARTQMYTTVTLRMVNYDRELARGGRALYFTSSDWACAFQRDARAAREDSLCHLPPARNITAN